MAWVQQHGFERQEQLSPLLEQTIREAWSLFDPHRIYQFGIVITGQCMESRVCISEVLLLIRKSEGWRTSDSSWFTIVTIELIKPFNEAALLSAFSSLSDTLKVATRNRLVVLQREGIILPTQLDMLFVQINHVLAEVE